MSCILSHSWVEEPISSLGQQIRRCRKCDKVQVRYFTVKKGSTKFVPQSGWKDSR